MNTLQALEQAVMDNPAEDTPALMLWDFAVEFMNYNEVQAAFLVSSLQTVGREKRELAQATDLFATPTRSVRRFKRYVVNCVSTNRAWASALLVLVAGDQAPHGNAPPPGAPDDQPGPIVTVGAGWVIKEWCFDLSNRRAAARTRYRRRTRGR